MLDKHWRASVFAARTLATPGHTRARPSALALPPGSRCSTGHGPRWRKAAVAARGRPAAGSSRAPWPPPAARCAQRPRTPPHSARAGARHRNKGSGTRARAFFTNLSGSTAATSKRASTRARSGNANRATPPRAVTASVALGRGNVRWPHLPTPPAAGRGGQEQHRWPRPSSQPRRDNPPRNTCSTPTRASLGTIDATSAAQRPLTMVHGSAGATRHTHKPPASTSKVAHHWPRKSSEERHVFKHTRSGQIGLRQGVRPVLGSLR